METLPNEVWALILAHLQSGRAVNSLLLASRHIYDQSLDERFWHGLYHALPDTLPTVSEKGPERWGKTWRWLYCARTAPLMRDTALPLGAQSGVPSPLSYPWALYADGSAKVTLQCVFDTSDLHEAHVFIGFIVYPHRGVIYHGQVVAGLPHGYGVVLPYTLKHTALGRTRAYIKATWHTKSPRLLQGVKRWGLGEHGWLQGRWNEGVLRDGHGAFVLLDRGDRYMGEIRDSMPDGHGLYTFASGAIYRGEWREGQRHGHGFHTSVEGTQAWGEWKNNKLHGWCHTLYSNGDQHRGRWERGKKHGWGVYANAAAHWRYEGNYKLDLFDGHGAMHDTRTESVRYQGRWSQGKRHGQGVHSALSGVRYEGEWTDGMPSGYGVATAPDGRQYKGVWLVGKMHGHGTHIYRTGMARYEGEWVDGRRSGQGTTIYASGDRFTGEWLGDQKYGRGLYRYADGASLRGRWSHGKRHGPCVWHAPDGQHAVRVAYRDGRLLASMPITCDVDSVGDMMQCDDSVILPDCDETPSEPWNLP